jgi:hypothetical protein
MKPSNIALSTGIFWTGFVLNARIAIPFSDFLSTKMSNISYLNKEKTPSNSFNPDLIKAGRFIAMSSALYASVLAARKFLTEHETNVLFLGFYIGAMIAGKALTPIALKTTATVLKYSGASSSIDDDYNLFIANRTKLVHDGVPIQSLTSLKDPFIKKHGLANYMRFYTIENATVLATALAVNSAAAYILL